MSGAVSEATVQAGEVLVNSLSLLGISTSAASREYGCEICAEMFVQPNQKALNTVLHLLFDRILGKETFKKEIKGAWPVKDSVHQRDFNKILHKHMLELSAKGLIPTHLAGTLLQAFRQASGPRLTTILCYLAAHALTKDPSCSPAQGAFIFQDIPSHPQAAESVFKVVRAQNTMQRESFVVALQDMSNSQGCWEEAAQKLSDDYRSTWQELADLKSKDPSMPPLDSEAAAMEEIPLDEGKLSEQQELVQSQQTAEALWLAVMAGAQKQNELRERLVELVASAKHPHAVDGAELQLKNEATTKQMDASDLPEIHLASTLKDLSTLLDTCQAGLPEAQEVERLKLQSRAITPLLAPEQHAQVVNINGQHSRRLHGQKEAFNNLRELLSASGSQKSILVSKVDAQLGLSQPELVAPGSPAKDLIKAMHPVGEHSIDAAEADVLLGMPQITADTGTQADKKQLSMDLKAAISLPVAENARARLRKTAYPTSFGGKAQILQPYIANTAATILEPSGSVPDFAARFLPKDIGQRHGVEAIKAAQRHEVEQHVLVAKGPKTEPVSHTNSVGGAASPRRLSFSGTTPSTVTSELLRSVDHQEKHISSVRSGSWVSTEEESVAKLRVRLSQLRSRS